MKAIVDQELCIGCGVCPEVCPQVFQMNDEDLAEVIADPVPPEAEESARDAASQCPVEAISIEE